MDLLTWLNANAGAVQAITTFVLVVITAGYTLLTHRLARSSEEAVSAAKQQFEATSRPYITIKPFGASEDDARVLFLSVANTGQSAAEDVELRLDQSFHVNGEADAKWDLAHAYLFTQSIPYFPPGQKFVFLLGDHRTLFELNGNRKEGPTPRVFTVTAIYSYLGRIITGPGERTTVNLAQYELSLPPRDPVVRELKGIREVLSKA